MDGSPRDRRKYEDVLQILKQNEISEMVQRVKQQQAKENQERIKSTLEGLTQKRGVEDSTMKTKSDPKPGTHSRWKGPHIRPKKKRQKKMKKQEFRETSLETSSEVMQILQNLEMAKARREQADTVTMLEKIHSRVRDALVHFGVNPDLQMSQTQIMAEATLKNRPPGYTTKEMRERILHQRSVVDHIHEYLQVCLRRNALMDEVVFWMNETTEAVAREMTNDSELIVQEQEEKEINRAIRNAILTAETSAKKIKRLSETIFQEVHEIMEEEEESADTESEGPNRLYNLLAARRKTQHAQRPQAGPGDAESDDTSLMGDAENWKKASQEVKQALTEASKTARNANVKNAAKQALKQFNFICIAMERRNKEAAQFGQEMLDCQLKINQVTKANERLQNERDRLKMSLDDCNMRLEKRKYQVEDLEQKNNELQEYIEALEEGGIWKRPSTVTIPPTPEIPLIDESGDELAQYKSENEALKRMVQELRNENKQIKDRLSKLSVQVSKLQNGLMLAKENAKHMEKQLELSKTEKSDQQSEWQTLKDDHTKVEKELKDTIAQLERDIALLKTEIKGKDEAIQFQEKRLKEVTHEAQTTSKKARRASIMAKGKVGKMATDDLSDDRQAVNRLKSDYEAEINRMKEHLLKEKQRCEATLRRQDQELNNRLQGIHKECLHLLRAINRFKESMAVIFDREGLLDLAHEMRTTMKDLPTDELTLPQDTKVMLNTVSGLATELMVALEFKVSQAMINKRIELKETQLMKKASAEEQAAEAESQQEKLTRARQQIEQLQEKLSKAKDDVLSTENLLTETKRIHEEKYQSLLERYKNLIINHNAAQREITTIRKDLMDEIKKKDAKLQELRQTMTQAGYSHEQAVKRLKIDLRQAKSKLVQSRINLADKLEPESIKFSLQDQKKNLDKLSEALQEDKISEDMHFITMEIIKRSMDIPIIRLRNLFERYIQFRKFRDNRDKLRKQLNQTTGAEHWELRQFIENMEKRMVETNKRWHERAEKVKQERTKLYEQMKAIFEAVYEESGILLIKPVFVYASKKPPEIVSGGGSGRRSSVAMQVYSKGVYSAPESPDGLIGRHMNLIGDRGPVWKMLTISEDDDTAVVTTPRMLEMDVNKERRKAKQSLTPSGRQSGMGDSRVPLNLPPLATFMVTQSPFSPELREEEEEEDDDYDEDQLIGW